MKWHETNGNEMNEKKWKLSPYESVRIRTEIPYGFGRNSYDIPWDFRTDSYGFILYKFVSEERIFRRLGMPFYIFSFYHLYSHFIAIKWPKLFEMVGTHASRGFVKGIYFIFRNIYIYIYCDMFDMWHTRNDISVPWIAVHSITCREYIADIKWLGAPRASSCSWGGSTLRVHLGADIAAVEKNLQAPSTGLVNRSKTCKFKSSSSQ